MSPIEVGSVLEGRVTGITRFGAFIDIGEGRTGLVHISEIADAFVHDVNDYLKQNDVVRVKVIAVESGKVGLSIKQADPNYLAQRARRDRAYQQSFEDKLTKFLKDSEERHQDLKRNQDSKRGGRGTRLSRMV
ncbi:MAG TPA: S1 RNA-binding domain-containing protein [Bacillota bacterium]|jgi:S1 RNA binding domain protein|nr:MAG: General stress protein 13 [Firmicutes bacterium ADurb.BinA052]HNY69097.1 S1 RNA-binding domain-containing protein [Bacillota bacterium]